MIKEDGFLDGPNLNNYKKIKLVISIKDLIEDEN